MTMPTIQVFIYDHYIKEQKRDLVRNLTDAAVKSLAVPIESVTIYLHELSKENVGKLGKIVADS